MITTVQLVSPVVILITSVQQIVLGNRVLLIENVLLENVVILITNVQQETAM